MLPAVKPAEPNLVMFNTGLLVILVVIVDVLLPGVGSVMPAGLTTIAVLLSVPVTFDATLPVIVKVVLCLLVKVRPVQFPLLLL